MDRCQSWLIRERSILAIIHLASHGMVIPPMDSANLLSDAKWLRSMDGEFHCNGLAELSSDPHHHTGSWDFRCNNGFEMDMGSVECQGDVRLEPHRTHGCNNSKSHPG